MALPAFTAWWFLPFVGPLCLYVAYTDLAFMKITNKAVLGLVAIYALVGTVAMPTWDAYFWGFAHMGILLVAGVALNAAGAMGAGDAKFIAAAAPFVALGDLKLVITLFMGILLAAYCVHRLARATALRNLAPDWQSWRTGRRFPMGLALGPTLCAYLMLAALNGA